MNEPFDPYYRWLGIPTGEQPPNHYRLLGLQVLESDPDVIANAADRQMLHVRTFQTGPHAGFSQRLLNEIAAARLCLLRADEKAAYDRRLYTLAAGRRCPQLGVQPGSTLGSAPTQAPWPVEPAPRPSPAIVQPPMRPMGPIGQSPRAAAGLPVAPQPQARPSTRSRRSAARKNWVRDAMGVAAGGATGIVIALCVLWYGFGVDPLGVMSRIAPEFTQEVADANHVRPSATSAEAPRPGAKDLPATGAPKDSQPQTSSKQPSAAPAGASPPPMIGVAPSPPKVSPSPSNGAASPPTVVVNPDPFAQLPPQWPIAAAQGVYDIGAVSAGGVANWTVSIFSDLADLQGAYEFFVSAPGDLDTRGGEWLIQLQAVEGVSASSSETEIPRRPVGRLFVDNGRLKFEWTGDVNEPMSLQLLNAVVSLSDGVSARQFCCRRPESQPEIALNLDQKSNIAPLNIAAPPPSELLVLHVEDVSNLPSGTQVEPTPAKLRVGDRLTATTQVSEDLKSEIQLDFEMSGPKLDVRIRSWYRAGDRREEFTSENVASDYLRLQKKIAQDQAELRGAESALRSLDSALASLGRRSAATPAEAASLRSQISTLQNQRGKAVGSIRRLTSTLPKTTNAAAQLEQVANLGRQLHNKVQFHARLVAASADREITLLRFGNPPQQ